MGLLLENTRVLGVRKALLVLREVERMSRESVEGQAIELAWIRNGHFDLDDRDYVRMAYKKTCWYTVIAPLRIGMICGGPPGSPSLVEEDLIPLIELGHLAGIAFQICDDLLNLEADEAVYGKESSGDLWEGKRTVMLLHFVRAVQGAERERALRFLRTPRREKRATEVAWLRGAMEEAGSLRHGRRLAQEYSVRALEMDQRGLPFVEENEDRNFLREMLAYIIDRVK
jgi:geranylgeranyl diphosphate synthase type II